MHLWNILVPGGPCVVNEMDAEMLSGEYPITYGYLQLLRSIVRKGILPKTYLSVSLQLSSILCVHQSCSLTQELIPQPCITTVTMSSPVSCCKPVAFNTLRLQMLMGNSGHYPRRHLGLLRTCCNSIECFPHSRFHNSHIKIQRAVER